MTTGSRESYEKSPLLREITEDQKSTTELEKNRQQRVGEVFALSLRGRLHRVQEGESVSVSGRV